MDHVPITGLEELQNHLQHVAEDPETPLEAKLFDEVELQLNGKIDLSLCVFHTVPKGDEMSSGDESLMRKVPFKAGLFSKTNKQEK